MARRNCCSSRRIGYCWATPDNAVEIVGNGSSMDSFVGEDGAVITVLKMELPWMDEGYEAQIMALEGMGRSAEGAPRDAGPCRAGSTVGPDRR